MTNKAHITNRPNHQIGDKVLGLCGKEFKVKVLWSDLPKDKRICRKCVDAALAALTQADDVIQGVRTRWMLLNNQAERLSLTLDKDLDLDVIADNDAALIAEQEMKARQKAERKQAKKTCTCTWSKSEIETVDPDCPIHGDLAQPSEEVVDE